MDFRLPAERLRRLAHDEGRAGHALDAAGDGEVDLAGPDGARRRPDRIEARGAEPVQRGARHVFRQAGQQHGHAGHVAVVLAGLVGAAVEHLVELRPVGLVIARHQRLDRQGGEIVGADLGKRPGVAADGRADPVAQKYVAGHAAPPWALLVRA